MKVRGKVLLSFALTLIYLICPCLVSVSAQKVVVFLKSKAQVEDDVILLGDIAEEIRADGGLKERLLKARIGSSPLPGKRRTLSRDYILVRLYQKGLSPEDVAVLGSSEIVVTRESILSDLSGEKKPSLKDQVFLVKRGDLVRLMLETKNLKIVTRGKALESGKKGDIIEILNMSSLKKIKGEIVAPLTVKVSPFNNF